MIQLSRHVPAEESIRSLLSVAYLESLYVFTNRRAFAPDLYERLAQVLSRLTEFTPDSQERQFLQQVVLNPKQFPGALRLAALLTLGDHPELLTPKFWGQLETLQLKEKNPTLRAAVKDILGRR
ncbi:MAG: hypothetical protein QM758_03105 [Armatimonas sp.]